MLKLFAVILFTCKTMYNKTFIRFGFCDIRNNQGLGKCYQRKPKPLITVTSTLIIPDITKTSSNNCLQLHVTQNVARVRPPAIHRLYKISEFQIP